MVLRGTVFTFVPPPSPLATPGTPSHGDHFFRDVAAMSGDGSIPFHVSPGNGDSGGNFSEYRVSYFQ